MLLALSIAGRRREHRAPDQPEVRLHFSSRVSGALRREDLARIVHASWRNNAQFGITGRLTFDGTGFEQVMEGPAEAVAHLAASILADDRHEAIDVKGFGLISARRHDRWEFAGFDDALQILDLPPDDRDLTNVLNPDFGRARRCSGGLAP